MIACPKTGGGVHAWLLAEANRCRIRKMSEAETANHLRRETLDCGRSVPGVEINATVRTAFRGGGQSREHIPPTSTWPALNERRRSVIVREYGGLAELWAMSPVRFDVTGADKYIAALFPGNPLLCAGLGRRPCV
jgi:hypothetical protein